MTARPLREGLSVVTKKRQAGVAKKTREETQTHTLRDGRVMQSAKTGVLAACTEGRYEDVQNALNEDRDGVVARVVDRHGSTALHWAAGAGHLDICKLLVARLPAGYLHAVNKDGRNALHWAARNGHVPVVEWVLASGEGIDSTTKNGNTALHWAIWGGQLEMCRWLIAAGASLDVENATQCTAVHWAAARGRVDICEYLVTLGADFHKINSAGHGAVTKAAWEGHSDLVFWLLNKLALGYQLELVDVHGCTTAELAEKNNHTHLAAAIRDWQAAQTRGPLARGCAALANRPRRVALLAAAAAAAAAVGVLMRRRRVAA